MVMDNIGKSRFKAAALAVQANIKIRNRFSNPTEDPLNPYSNHSETEESSDEGEDEIRDVEAPQPQLPGIFNGRASIPRTSRASQKKRSPLRRYKGMLLALLSSFIFSVGALVAKKLHDYHPFSIAFWRFQGAFLPVLPLIMYKMCWLDQTEKVLYGIWPMNQLKKMGLFSLVLLRSCLSSNAMLLQFYSLKYMNLGDSMTIASSTPILVTLFARIFLGEKCGVVTIVASVLTMVGVVTMTRPPMLTGEASFDTDTLIGSGLALGCMVLAAISYTVLRYIRKVHYTVTTLMFGVWGTVENLILSIAFQVLKVPDTLGDIGLILTLAVLAFLGQCTIVLAMRAEQAGPVALVRTCDVIFGFALQIAILGTNPDWLSIVGSIIVVISVFLCGFRKWLRGLPVGHPTRARFRYFMM